MTVSIQLSIRELTIDDLSSVKKLGRQHPGYFPDTGEMAAEWINSEKILYYGAFQGDKLVGISGLEFKSEEMAYIFGVRVDNRYFRQGIGLALFKYGTDYSFEQNYKCVTFITHSQNHGSIRCGEKLGYKLTGEMEIWSAKPQNILNACEPKIESQEVSIDKALELLKQVSKEPVDELLIDFDIALVNANYILNTYENILSFATSDAVSIENTDIPKLDLQVMIVYGSRTGIRDLLLSAAKRAIENEQSTITCGCSNEIAPIVQSLGFQKLFNMVIYKTYTPIIDDQSLIQEDRNAINDLEELLGEKIPKLEKPLWPKIGYEVEDSRVISLCLRGVGLPSLPDTIGNLTNLQKLYLGWNKLTSLPETIGNLKNLNTLDLFNNKLSALPTVIGNLILLQEVNLSINKLTTLPSTFMNLNNLKKLDLWENQLASIPETIENLTGLEYLNLTDNNLESLPEGIGDLIALEELSINDNSLSFLPGTIGKLSNLQKLHLDNNKLTTLPEIIGNLTNLKELCLYSNQLNSLPETIGELTNLQKLHLENNMLTALPRTFGRFTSLQYLHLINNQLSTLPETIGDLTSLQELHLYNNKISSLPESLWNLKKLEHLNLGKNQFKSLPEMVGNLSNLQKLDLIGNQLTNLPESIGNLKNLQRLYVEENEGLSISEGLNTHLEHQGCDIFI
ncbi:MAG: GNAT family N-acetyltransferase [Candidatus Heimdallarchaeota archaeon]|nr:GNAT family N-acetyltransferase [Candidatus Heimdallarchaeota archaeon]MCK5047842.1 GNAT family N-acetyltransferase [Candidatus Heimdallarchaeota archaeon]